MSHPKRVKKMVIKISRHPFIMDHSNRNYEEHVEIRNCRVNLERIKSNPTMREGRDFALKPKAKRCCVRVARLPNTERSEISETPGSSIVCSDFDDDSRAE